MNVWDILDIMDSLCPATADCRGICKGYCNTTWACYDMHDIATDMILRGLY